MSRTHECEYDSDGGACRVCGKTVAEQLGSFAAPSGSAILACPFCGLKNTSTIADEQAMSANQMYALICNECHAAGPSAGTYADAVRYWNSRTNQDAIERAIDALKYRVGVLAQSIGNFPQHLAEVMEEGMRNDNRAIETLRECLSPNDKLTGAT